MENIRKAKQDDLIRIIKSATQFELKTYHDVIKSLRKNFKELRYSG